MKTTPILLFVLLSMNANALQLPGMVDIWEQGTHPCDTENASWFIDLNQLNLFRPYSPCEMGLAVLDAGEYLDSINDSTAILSVEGRPWRRRR